MRPTQATLALMVALCGIAIAAALSPARATKSAINDFRQAADDSAARSNTLQILIQRDPIMARLEWARWAVRPKALPSELRAARDVLAGLLEMPRVAIAASTMLGLLKLNGRGGPIDQSGGIVRLESASRANSAAAAAGLARHFAQSNKPWGNATKAGAYAAQAVRLGARAIDLRARAAVDESERRNPQKPNTSDQQPSYQSFVEQALSSDSVRAQMALSHVATRAGNEPLAVQALERASLLASSTNNAGALTQIALAFSLGEGAPMDRPRARAILAQAKALGDPQASSVLALLDEAENASVPQKSKELQ